MLASVRKDMRRQADPAKARILQGFFKTGPGQYGEGDIFLGLVVPKSRALARKYEDLALADILALLRSPVHEERLLALFILVRQFERGDRTTQKRIYGTYLKNTRYINNWDLVDLSAEKIIGAYLYRGYADPSVLFRLARSSDLWERRIAILATFHYIKAGESGPTLAIAKILLRDTHDLIHKAVGWMLREVGKRIDSGTEEAFLKEHYTRMPRTMLRYAIERFPEEKRRQYLCKKPEAR